MEFNQDIHLDPANENAQVSSENEALEMPATKSHPSRVRPRGKFIWDCKFMVNERVLCYVGPRLYFAKCVKLKKDSSNRIFYFIHYKGWNRVFKHGVGVWKWVFSAQGYKLFLAQGPEHKHFFSPRAEGPRAEKMLCSGTRAKNNLCPRAEETYFHTPTPCLKNIHISLSIKFH